MRQNADIYMVVYKQKLSVKTSSKDAGCSNAEINEREASLNNLLLIEGLLDLSSLGLEFDEPDGPNGPSFSNNNKLITASL